MDNLTARQKYILNSIIEEGPLNIKGLSQRIDISERTVMREISAINEWLKQYDLRIFESKGRLKIDGNKDCMDKVTESSGSIPALWLLNQEQRMVLISAQLLLANEPIKSAYFSYQFNVVEGTISFYLDKIEKWLKARNLTLIRKRGYGIEIKGSDWNKRNAFVELTYNYKPINELLSFLFEGRNDHTVITFFKIIFGEELISLVKELIEKLESSNILKQGDVEYFSAFIHILIAIKRTQDRAPIVLPEYIVLDILSSEKFLFIKDINKLFQDNGIILPDDELAYLAIHLKGEKYIYKNNREFEEIGVDFEDLVKEVVHLVSKKLNIELKCDNQLIVGLEQHFIPAFYRLTMGLQVRNPIINEIKEYYSDLFEAVDYACRIVFSKYNLHIPSSEVGYITMHIGSAIERQHASNKKLNALVICPNGLGTAKILYNKLKNNFPELEEIDVCSLRDMGQKINENYDIVLSTINIDNKLYKNVIVVSPFLQKKDIENINSLIKAKIDEYKSIDGKVSSLNEYKQDDLRADFETANNLLKNFQLKDIDADNFKAVIKTVVDEICSLNTASNSERLKYLINKREEQGSVVIPGSHIALIHVRAEEINASFIGAYRLKKFIRMKSIGFSVENVDTFFVMLAMKNESGYILELLGKISISLAENKEFVEILRLGSLKDIRNELVEILNREEDL